MKNEQPHWSTSATRLMEAPRIDSWWKPESHGKLEGILEWSGVQDGQFGPQRVYVFRMDDGRTCGVREYARLRRLRPLKIGSRVLISPREKSAIEGGKMMWEFDVDFMSPHGNEGAPANHASREDAGVSDINEDEAWSSPPIK